MKNVLGVGFPYQLSPSQRTKLSFPAVDFTAAAPGLMKMSNDQIKTFVTTGVFFVTKFRESFQGARLRYTTAAESTKWLYHSNIQCWAEQLNIAVYVESLAKSLTTALLGVVLGVAVAVANFRFVNGRCHF